MVANGRGGRRLKAEQATVDGEIVAVDAQGRLRFKHCSIGLAPWAHSTRVFPQLVQAVR